MTLNLCWRIACVILAAYFGRLLSTEYRKYCFTMTTENPVSCISPSEIPAAWRADAEMQLRPKENVLTSVEVELDARLHCVKGMVIVTVHRILARAQGETTW